MSKKHITKEEVSYEWNTLYRSDAMDYIKSFYDYCNVHKDTFSTEYLVEALANLLYNLQDECTVNTEYAMKKALYKLAQNETKYIRYSDMENIRENL